MARTLAAASSSKPPVPAAGRVFGLFTPHLNRYVARVAGGRFTPMWALLRHRGRTSGKSYTTPITARRVRDGFTIGLAFGMRTDWLRNAVAGEASIRWRGREYPLGLGEVLDISSARLAFPSWERAVYRRMGIERFLYLRDRETPDR